MSPQDIRNTWNVLQLAWRAANATARMARWRVTQAYAAQATGNGAGPTIEELEEADDQERTADRMAVELDNFVTKVLEQPSAAASAAGRDHHLGADPFTQGDVKV